MTKQVIVGEIAGAFGVKGWVKVHSHTIPADNILGYSPWLLEDGGEAREFKVLSGRMHGASVVACLEGVDDRDKALRLRSRKIMVPRERFPPAEEGRYYWADLIGLRVRSVAGTDFGTVAEMMETGANDVIVVQGERERLIPFVIGQYVKEIDLEEGLMVVDWDPEF